MAGGAPPRPTTAISHRDGWPPATTTPTLPAAVATRSQRDYYEVLGVRRDATVEDIKRAYRKLAIRFHPDKNPDDPAAEESFKEASEAYTILSDPDKRVRYDRLGHAAFESTGPGGFDAVDLGAVSDILEGILGDMFGGRRRRRPGRDLTYELEVQFEEAALGAEKKIEVSRPMPCETCKGSGARPGTQPKTCAECRGRGEVRFQKGFFTTTRPCGNCRGTGHIVDDPCAGCKGLGMTQRQEEMIVRVPPGVEDGAVRTVRGAGEVGPAGPGDLHVTIRVREHPLFTRSGADIQCEVPVSFPQAVLGTTLEVPTLEGKVRMKLPPGTQSGRTFRLRGKGIPVLGGYGKGDQLVRVLVEVPEKVSKKQRRIIEELAEEMGVDTHPQQQTFLDKLKSIFE